MLDTLFIIAAVIGSTVMVCQFVLTLLGLGDHSADFSGDVHGDAHFGDAGGDGSIDHTAVNGTTLTDAAGGQLHHADSSWLFGVLTFRSLVAAAAFFGLTGMAMLRAGYSHSTSTILAVGAGLAAMYGMYWSMRMIASLSSSGNERIHNAVGRKATVYLRIPAERRGAGKIQISMQNRILEFQAVTDDHEPLKTGQTVEVVDVATGDTLCVTRICEPVEV